MKEERYFYVPRAQYCEELPSDEAQHATRVLRLTEGDEVMLTDGEGSFYRALLTLVSRQHCCYRVLETIPQPRPWSGAIHVAVAPTKNADRMEWMAEKLTEVGIDRLTFLQSQFSERRQVNLARMERIVLSAIKQSKKAWLPVVDDVTPFTKFVSRPFAGRKYIAHCYDEFPRPHLFGLLQQPVSTACDDVLVMVGPEGDFSVAEVRQAMDLGFTPVSLGTSRLRTETAGLVAGMMAHLALERP